MKLPDVEPGYGIDIVRLEAAQTEPLHRARHKGHFEATAQAKAEAAAMVRPNTGWPPVGRGLQTAKCLPEIARRSRSAGDPFHRGVDGSGGNRCNGYIALNRPR